MRASTTTADIPAKTLVAPPQRRALEWRLDDGGRAAAGFRGRADDCVTRAIAIASGRPYRDVYNDLFERARQDNERRRAKSTKLSPRLGSQRGIYEPYLAELGWEWVPTMRIGSGCQVHLAAGELPGDRPLIARLSRHVAAVIDGVVHDTYDPTAGGLRCVYGYFQPAR